MANGDIAASIGLPTVAATDDIKMGYDDINQVSDAIATHIISGTHDSSKILNQQNINAGKLNGIKIFVQSGTPTASAVGDLWAW